MAQHAINYILLITHAKLTKWGIGGSKHATIMKCNATTTQCYLNFLFLMSTSPLKYRHVTPMSYLKSIHLITKYFKVNNILGSLALLPPSLLICQCPWWQLTVVLIVPLLRTNLGSSILYWSFDPWPCQSLLFKTPWYKSFLHCTS